MKLNDDIFFFGCDVPSFQIRSQIVDPSEPTTFPTAEKPYKHINNKLCKEIFIIL